MKTNAQNGDLLVALNPAFVQALVARGVLSAACAEAQRLQDLLEEQPEQEAAADLYRKLCLTQAELETLRDALSRVRAT